MEIKIGADELILWLRKNKKAEELDNGVLGRKIADLITSFDGRFGESNVPALWNSSNDGKLPMTSQQYIVDVEKLPDLFRKLAEW